MRSFVTSFVIAALLAAILTPVVRRLALRLGAVSGTSDRHAGQRGIPRLGGVAICVALFAPVIGLFFVEAGVSLVVKREALRVVGLGIGGLAMCAVGVIDDTRHMRAVHKLLCQIAVAVVAFACGFRIEVVTIPFVAPLPMGIFALPVTIVWIVGIVNAVNLIDGLDGLAAGVVFIAGVTNFVVANLAGAFFSALVMASVLGAVLGFLLYNFNPARIFMGDSGSYLLGYVLAATALVGNGQKASTAVSLLVPVIALGVPIFDTLFAMVRRILERRPLFAPDRGHIHHRLLDMGLTHRRAVLTLYGVSIVLTAAAIGVYLGRAWQVGLALLAATVVVIGLVRFVGAFSYSLNRRRQAARLRSADCERLRRALPELPAKFASADSESHLFAMLSELGERVQLVSCVVRPTGDGVPSHSWSDANPNAARAVASQDYPLGEDALARAQVTFGTVNDLEDTQMLPEMDILLQVVADLLAANLVRLGSELAPRVTTVEEPTAHEGDVARAVQDVALGAAVRSTGSSR